MTSRLRSIRYLTFGVGILVATASYGTTLTQQRADFRKAEKALKQGKLKKYSTLVAGLQDYPLYPYLVFNELSNKLYKQPEVEQFLSDNSHSRYAFWLRRKLLKYTASKGQWQRYVNNYQDQKNAQLTCYYHWGQHQLGDRDAAFEGARKLWLTGRSMPDACNPLFNAWRADTPLTQALIWERYALAMQSGKTGLQTYLKKLLPKSERAKANFWQQVHRSPSLVEKCSKWNTSDPVHGQIFTHGIERLSRTRIGVEKAQQLWRQHKDSFTISEDEIGRVDRKLALKLAVRRSSNAHQALTEVAGLGVNEEVREWRVRTAIRQQNWDSVLSWIEQLNNEEQNSPRWSYWRARALEAQGFGPQAKTIYQQLATDRSFYGFVAADRVGVSYTLTDRPVRGGDKAAQALAQTPPFKMVQEWRHFNRKVNARRIWWDTVKILSDDDIHAAAQLAHNWGWDQIAIFTIAKAKYWDDLELRFPLAYKDLVTKYAGERQLDPSMIYGLIRQESAFNHTARSPSGARGLMQIMPRTGKDIARMLKDRKWSVAKLNDPAVNVRYGTKYISKMMQRFDHSFALSAAAYNAGPHRVDTWLPRDKTMPADIWVESIPFDETRHYVKAVLEFAVIYQHRMHQQVATKISNYLPDVFVSTSGKSLKPVEVALKSCSYNLGLARK